MRFYVLDVVEEEADPELYVPTKTRVSK